MTTLDDEMVTRLRQAIRRLARELNQSSTDEGLTPSNASVLGVVAARGQVSLPELAHIERVNPTMLSRVVGKLEAAGLIARTADPNDLRSAIVTPTARGKRVQQTIKANRARVMACAARGLTADQQRKLAAALPALEALVDQLRQQESRL